jgi:hypothetical protein
VPIFAARCASSTSRSAGVTSTCRTPDGVLLSADPQAGLAQVVWPVRTRFADAALDAAMDDRTTALHALAEAHAKGDREAHVPSWAQLARVLVKRAR